MSKPRIITVSGSGADVGKTALVEKLVGIVPDCGAIKLRPEEDLSAEVIEETASGGEPRKDTERMLAAGAVRAWLVQGPAEWTLEKLRELLRESDCDTVVIESNYAAKEIEPDLSFYVKGPGPAKPGALTVENDADIIVLSTSLTGENRDATRNTRQD